MFHLQLIITAIRGLQQNLLRSTLATIGVIIGVGAVVSAVSILQGAQRDVLDQFESLGADQLIVVDGKREHGGVTSSVQALVPGDAEKIQQEYPDLILRVSPQYQGAGQIKYFQQNVNGFVLGVTETYAPMNSYEVEIGRFITRADVRGSTMVTVLGYGVAKDLFGALPAVGKNVKINGKSFVVIGVMEKKGTLGFLNVDEQAIIPLSTSMSRMFGQKYLSMLNVQCASATAIPACMEGVKKTLRVSHRIRSGSKDDFTIYTQEEMKQRFAQVAKIFGVVLYSIAGISLLVGAIGIMNIMLVSVTERTREIGVRLAVGARRFDILKQFLIEASIISLFGGALGVVAGWAMANFLGEFTQVIKTYTPPSIILASLIMAIFVGVVSGIYPAIRAARLDPVQALRYE